MEWEFLVDQRHSGAGGIGLSVLRIFQSGQVLQKHPGALQSDLSGGNKADVISRQNHWPDRQCGRRQFRSGDQGVHSLGKRPLKVRLDTAAEPLQARPAIVPAGSSLAIEVLHPLAHGIPVHMDHSNEVVLSHQFLELGGELPSLWRRQELRALGGGFLFSQFRLIRHRVQSLHAYTQAAEGALPQCLLLLQRGGQRHEVFARRPLSVVGHLFDEELHAVKPCHRFGRHRPRKAGGCLPAVELQDRMAAAGVNQVLLRAVQLPRRLPEKRAVGHIGDLSGSGRVLPQLLAGEDVVLFPGDLQNHQDPVQTAFLLLYRIDRKLIMFCIIPPPFSLHNTGSRK